MRLYSRTGASFTQHEGVRYEAAPDGGFGFPDHVSDVLHRFAVNGERMWESDIERQRRVLGEEMDRRRDPASLYEAVAKLVQAADAVQPKRSRAAAEK